MKKKKKKKKLTKSELEFTMILQKAINEIKKKKT